MMRKVFLVLFFGVSALFSSSLLAETCLDLGNYVRGSSPVVGGYIATPDFPSRYEKGLAMSYTSDGDQVVENIHNFAAMPEWGAQANQYRWTTRIQHSFTTSPSSTTGTYLVPYAIANNFTPTSPYSQVVLPRAFGQICTGTDPQNSNFVSSWIGTQFQYYLRPSCPPNTAPIQINGYKTNDGKNYAAGNRYIPAAFPPYSTWYDYEFGCPHGSKYMSMTSPLSRGCRLDNSIEVTVCVVTDTTE